MSLVDGLKLLFFLSRFFGLAPYALGKNLIRKSLCFTVYSFSFFGMNVFFQSSFVYYIFSSGSFGLVEGLLQSLDSITFALNCLGCTLLMLLRQGAMLEGIQKLNSFCRNTKFLSENCLSQLKRMGDRLTIFAFCFSSVFSITEGIVWAESMTTISEPVKYYFYLCGFFRIIICYLMCCHFVFYFTLVRLIHSSINGHLIRFANSWVRSSTSDVTPLTGIKFLMETDGWIKDLSEHWFLTFSLYGVCICAVVLFEIVYTAVYYYMKPVALYQLMASFMWIFYFLSQFFAVIIISVLATQEAEKTANYLHELFIDNDDIALKEEIEIFSLQLLHRKVEFNACGFFKLDFSLLYSMVGAVTTYIIILMQFQGNDEVEVTYKVNITDLSITP